jgi:hypothetical protein
MGLTKDVVAFVQEEFGKDATAALRALEREPTFVRSSRLVRSVVFLAEGNIRLLRALIEHAKAEYRDVLFWAEYSKLETDHPRHVRDFTRSLEHRGNLLTVERGAKNRLPADVKRSFARKQ